MEKLDKFFQQLFSFTRSEARAFLWLLIICIAALILLFSADVLFNQPVQISSEKKRMLDSLEQILENKLLPDKNIAHFIFDPNILPIDSLILLGLDKNVAERVHNYLGKGGVFRIKKDLKKIYGFPDQLYSELVDFIDLPDSLSQFDDAKSSIPFDINKVNATQLKEIHMIGDVLARRIVKYREALGGFTAKEQLNEVYDLTDPALTNLTVSIYIAKNFKPDLIQVNQASKIELEKHPYISGQLADDIIRFRGINNKIESEKVLVNFKSIDKSNFQKLILYLDFN